MEWKDTIKRTAMSYFDTILEKRNLEICPQPLWKLKITKEEYEELRTLLEKRTHLFQNKEPFLNFKRECTLFFAEYWRREYVDGKHSKQMVYKALESTRKSVDFTNDFYEKAIKGAKILKLEQYDGRRADPLNSLLYQGGLPMKLVTAEIINSRWDRFTRGLVNKRIDFEDLDSGLVAKESQSLKDYCDQMIVGIESKQYKLMPFYCLDEHNNWFLYLKNLASEEKKKKRKLHPFSLDWEFSVDTIEHKISTKYSLKGREHLSAAFLEEEGLNNQPFFSIQVRANGKVVDTFDYVNGFCRYSVISKHHYNAGDNISLILSENKEPHINEGLDMTVPHILYQKDNKVYVLGNQIGRKKSLLLIPQKWEVENEQQYEIKEYTWGDDRIRGILIDSNFKENIVVKGLDGKISFGMNTPMYWTELITHPLYQSDIDEPLYDARKCRYKLSFDTEEGTKSISNIDVQYRNKWDADWSNTPSFGEIYARGIDNHGNFVTPIQIINIGDGVIINLLKADSDSCEIQVSWPHGHVTTTEGTKKANNTWHIEKVNCLKKNKIQFLFTPKDNGKNQFCLSIKAPFKEFSILDLDENPISSNSWIPYTDLDKYQYHLVGQDVKEYKFGSRKRSLKWQQDKLYIFEEDKKLKSIPYQGSLLTLFDSRELIRAMLERTSQNMLKASIPVELTTSNHQTLNFEIKDFPFRPKQLEDGKIVITTKDKKCLNFKGVLKLLKLDEPELSPIIMKYNEENGYILPEEIRSWGKTILIGRAKGRVCPTLVDLSRNMDAEYRANTRDLATKKISENIQQSVLGDELWKRIIAWFKKTREEDIPASSLLELVCVAKNPDSLLCLAFQLYASCTNEDDKETLIEQLKSLSSDLAFQWYWLAPYLDKIMQTITPYIREIDNSVIQKMYINWALTKEEDMTAYLEGLSNETKYEEYIGSCLIEVLTSYTDWMKQLCIASMLDSYEPNKNDLIVPTVESIIKTPNQIYRINTDAKQYIETNQDNIDVETHDFFTKYNEAGKTENEAWLYKRVNVVLANQKKSINLLSESEEVKRSIIYCIKSCNEPFIIALNNKMKK